jgi:hypothetical protein
MVNSAGLAGIAEDGGSRKAENKACSEPNQSSLALATWSHAALEPRDISTRHYSRHEAILCFDG